MPIIDWYIFDAEKQEHASIDLLSHAFVGEDSTIVVEIQQPELIAGNDESKVTADHPLTINFLNGDNIVKRSETGRF